MRMSQCHTGITALGENETVNYVYGSALHAVMHMIPLLPWAALRQRGARADIVDEDVDPLQAPGAVSPSRIIPYKGTTVPLPSGTVASYLQQAL
jgi:hypothetical protein